MTKTTYPQTSEKFEIQSYKRPTRIKELVNNYVPYTGSPQRHPYDAAKIILVADPYSTNTFFYEFIADDIGYAEEMPSLVDINGETLPMARIWVKKGSVAVCSSPFVVEDTRALRQRPVET